MLQGDRVVPIKNSFVGLTESCVRGPMLAFNISGGWSNPGDSLLMACHRHPSIQPSLIYCYWTDIVIPLLVRQSHVVRGPMLAFNISGRWPNPGDYLLVSCRQHPSIGPPLIYCYRTNIVIPLLVRQRHVFSGPMLDFNISGRWPNPGNYLLVTCRQQPSIWPLLIYCYRTNIVIPLLVRQWKTSITLLHHGTCNGSPTFILQ